MRLAQLPPFVPVFGLLATLGACADSHGDADYRNTTPAQRRLAVRAAAGDLLHDGASLVYDAHLTDHNCPATSPDSNIGAGTTPPEGCFNRRGFFFQGSFDVSNLSPLVDMHRDMPFEARASFEKFDAATTYTTQRIYDGSGTISGPKGYWGEWTIDSDLTVTEFIGDEVIVVSAAGHWRPASAGSASRIADEAWVDIEGIGRGRVDGRWSYEYETAIDAGTIELRGQNVLSYDRKTGCMTISGEGWSEPHCGEWLDQ